MFDILKTKTTFLSGVAVATCVAASSAGAVTVSQEQVLDENGEDMEFVFDGLAMSNGDAGTVTITPSGSSGTIGLDLSGAFPLEREYFEVVFEGDSRGFYSCGGPSYNGNTAVAIAGAVDNSFNFNNCAFSLSIGIGGADLMAALADGMVTVGVFFGDDVSTFGDDDIVRVTLEYVEGGDIPPIPLPASIGFLGLGLLGLGGLARARRKSS